MFEVVIDEIEVEIHQKFFTEIEETETLEVRLRKFLLSRNNKIGCYWQLSLNNPKLDNLAIHFKLTEIPLLKFSGIYQD